MNYSFFIKRNIEYIKASGYIIYPKGNQIYKKIGNFEVLLTDYTGERILFERLVILVIWIKNSLNDEIIFEKVYKRNLFYPNMKKINNIINQQICKFEKEDK